MMLASRRSNPSVVIFIRPFPLVYHSKPVQFSILFSQGLDKGPVVRLYSRRALDQNGGRVTASRKVDPVAQPAEQVIESAAGERAIEAAQLGLRAGEQLGPVQIAQCISRKVAHQPG